jgi:hypothetical protein
MLGRLRGKGKELMLMLLKEMTAVGWEGGGSPGSG